MNTQWIRGETRSVRALAAGLLAGSALSVLAQQAPAPAITELTTIAVEQRGNPPTGAHTVVVEHDPGLPMHTIYRPKDLGDTRYPVLVWGEGGCAKNGLMFTEFLSEIASHGFVVIADGPPGTQGAGAGGPNGPGPGAGGPPRGTAGTGAPQRGGPGAPARPAVPGGMAPDGTDLIKGLDWLEAEATRAGSRFHDKVDVKRVAAMGMSCGGLMAYGASADPRVATVGIWNSGLVQPDPKILEGIHGSVIIVTGNDTDVAYPNGKRDFETLPAKVPVFYGVHTPVGHGGTYNQDNGGTFGPMAVAWLNWQLRGERGAAGRGYFAGDTCHVCKDSTWIVNTRSLP